MGNRALLLHQFGESEVREMRLAPGIKQNVAGFNVAMKNPPLMGVMNGASGGCDQLCRRPGQKWPLLLIQWAAFDQLHTEIWPSIVLAYFVDGNNVGMIQARGRFRFGAKSLYEIR